MPRKKKCRAIDCGEMYVKEDWHPSFRSFCSTECGIKLARERQDKARVKQLTKVKADEKRRKREFNAETAARREKIKTKSAWMRDLQSLMNRYVRLRDAKDGCISCSKPSSWPGQWHCSHYYPTSTSSYVRFNLWNMHKSCSECNGHKSGNIASYRPRIIEKIGKERFDWLESNHNNIAKYEIEWIKRAIKIVRKGIKRIDSAQ